MIFPVCIGCCLSLKPHIMLYNRCSSRSEYYEHFLFEQITCVFFALHHCILVDETVDDLSKVYHIFSCLKAMSKRLCVCKQ